MKKFTYYQDPGHGWLKVPRSLLVSLGIDTKITACSYQYGAYAYLEEDCDAGTFFEAYQARYGCKPGMVSRHTNKQSKVRSYESYNPNFNPVMNPEPGTQVRIYGKTFQVLEESGYRGQYTVQCADTGKRYRAKAATMSLVT